MKIKIIKINKINKIIKIINRIITKTMVDNKEPRLIEIIIIQSVYQIIIIIKYNYFYNSLIYYIQQIR